MAGEREMASAEAEEDQPILLSAALAVRARIPPAALTAAIGLLGVAMIGAGFWLPKPLIIVLGVVAAVLLSLALTDPLRRGAEAMEVSPTRAALSGTAIIVGGMSLAGSVVDNRVWLAILVVAIAAALAAFLPLCLRPDIDLAKDVPGTALVTGYASAAVVAGSWLLDADPSPNEALSTVNVVEAAFDVMVFALFRERFSRLFEEEAKRAAGLRDLNRKQFEAKRKELRDAKREELRQDRPQARQPPASETGAATVVSLALFGLAVLVGLAASVVAGADPLGLNDVVEGGEPSGVKLIFASGVAAAVIALGVLADGRVPRDPPTQVPSNGERPAIEVPAASWGVILLAALLLGVPPLLDGSERHLDALAVVLAASYAFLTAESLWNGNLSIQLARGGTNVVALVAAVSAATFSAAWWLLSIGLWSGDGPASALRATGAVVAVLVACAALGIAAGRVISRSGTGEAFTPQAPWDNAVQDHSLYAALALIAGVVPLGALAHLNANETPVTVVSSLLFLPGLIGGFLWVIDNNRFHHRIEQELKNPTLEMWLRALKPGMTAVARDEDQAPALIPQSETEAASTPKEEHLDEEEAEAASTPKEEHLDEEEARGWLKGYRAEMKRHHQLQNGAGKGFLAVGMIALAIKALGA